MNKNYYIAINGLQQGPFNIIQLKEMAIQKNTLVWTEGLENWTKAENVSELNDILKSTPPPLIDFNEKINSNKVPPLPNEEKLNDKYFGYKLAKRRERFLASLLEALIIYLPCTLIYAFIFDKDHFSINDSYFSVNSLKETIGYAIFAGILGAIFYPIWSGNLGHKILGLKVISSIDGQDKNNAVDGAFREGLKSVFGFFLLPVIWLLWDDSKQNLYDKVVKTYVVKIN